MESGLEIAFHTVDWQLKQLILMADQEIDDLPVAVQLDFANGYNNASRAAMISNVERWFPSLTRYTRLMYGTAGRLFCVADGSLLDMVPSIEGSWQGNPLGSVLRWPYSTS